MKQAQGRRLIALLKRRYWTVMELHQATGAPTAWHKKIVEFLLPHEMLEKVAGKGYRVVAATRWTA